MRRFHGIFGGAQVLSVNTPFRTTFGEYALVEKADALVNEENGLVLVKFKFRDCGDFYYESEQDQHLQLVFHSIGLHGLGVHPAKGVYYIFDSGRTASVTLSRTVMEEGKKRIAEVLDTLRRTVEFRARLGWHCEWCGFQEECHLHSQGRS